MKQFIKRHLPWLAITGIFLILTPQMFEYARTERGYDAIGGELFFPLLPLTGWAIWKTGCDITKEIKKIFENEILKNDEV
jgi:hypothetical protein